MLLSRWKMMAGVLGVTLGGLAAVAGQCPKMDSTKTSRHQSLPQEIELPKPPSIPSAGSAPTKTPPAPTTPTLPPAPSTPGLPPVPTVELPPAPPAAQLPDPPKVSAPAGLPPVPATPVIPAAASDPKPALPAPESVGKQAAEPVGKPTPPVVTPTPPAPTPTVDFAPPAPETKLLPKPTTPVATPPAPANGDKFGRVIIDGEDRSGDRVILNKVPPPTTVVPVPSAPPALEPTPVLQPTDPLAEPSPRKSPNPQVYDAPKATPTKYRILLRVGEGEPTFEVKYGDDLVLKVVCEKIDIKSPEKGAAGLSAVKASGKVRFVGFGAEGTCEELSFLAGTGEVSMVGAVKIQVKDKLGRVESELSTETMKYKIDPSAAFSSGRP